MTAAWPLFGHQDAEKLFLAAYAQRKLHHAWLIEGPMGIGKSRLAHRLAAFLLGAKGDSDGSFDAPLTDPVMQKLLASGHPDFRLIQRELNDRGKLRQDITVDQIRELTGFYSLKPALGGWRIAIVDALDEMNASGANALLKTLEEPPPKSVIFLVSHGSKSLLPTIRSRCRVLRLRALNEADASSALKSAEAPREAKALSRGRPGLGMQLASPAGISSADAARALLRAMPKPRESVVATAHRAASVDRVAMAAFREEVLSWLAESAEDNPTAAKLWLEVSRLFGDADALNMEPSQTVSKVIAGLHASGTGR